MYISKFNSEGYTSPTEYEALTNIAKDKVQRYMPMVYICSPYSGNVDNNVKQAQWHSRFAYENGYIPIAPHLLFPQFMSESNPEERSDAITMDIAVLSHCKQIWVFGNNITSGMQKEINYARKKHKRIRYFNLNHKEEQNI